MTDNTALPNRPLTSRTLLCVALCAALAGCATDDPNRRAKTGAAVGAAAGGILGAIIGDGKGAVIGAGLGAVGGAIAGDYMDQQQREFEDALAEEQRQNDIEIERLRDDTLRLSLNSEVSFDVDRADIKPAFYDTLDKLADVVVDYDRTVMHVIGHTDSDGSETYNLDLSRRRAEAVAEFIVARGVPWDRVRVEGRGESQPRASNATAAGKQLNRRVEIFLKPIVEGRENEAYVTPIVDATY